MLYNVVVTTQYGQFKYSQIKHYKEKRNAIRFFDDNSYGDIHGVEVYMFYYDNDGNEVPCRYFKAR